MLAKKFFFYIEITTMILCSFIFNTSYAQENEKFIMTLPEEKKILTSEEYAFIEQQYDPPFEIPVIPNYREASRTTPEDAFISDFSAILHDDVAWRQNFLTESEKKVFENKSIEEKEKQIGLLKKQANVLLKGNKVILERKITTSDGSYVILDYSVVKSGKKIMSWFKIFVLERNSWKVCGVCGSTPEHPLYVILDNFRFSEQEKIITDVKLDTKRPSAPQFKFKEK
jgi:hypothetical protein